MDVSGPFTQDELGDRGPARVPAGEVLPTAVGWLVTRALLVTLLFGLESKVKGNIHYFARHLAAAHVVGLSHTLVEYPLPGVVALALPWLLVHLLGMHHAYAVALVLLLVVTDAVFMAMIWRFSCQRRRSASAVWVAAVPLLGATAYARFDLFPGVLTGLALLMLARRPRLAGAAAAVATGLKFWPALVLPALAARKPNRTRFGVAVAVVGSALVAGSVALAGWNRLVSPLAYQVHRGLQIESVAATPAMVGWAARPLQYRVHFAFHAFQVTGPWTHELLRLSTVLTVVVLVFLLRLWYLAFRSGRSLTLDTVSWMALTAVTAFMVTSKVLSPQYLLWLLPLAAAAVGVSRSRSLRAWTAVLLLTTALTQLVFPLSYGGLLTHGVMTPWAVLALATRNALLVCLLVWAGGFALRGVHQALPRTPHLPAAIR